MEFGWIMVVLSTVCVLPASLVAILLVAGKRVPPVLGVLPAVAPLLYGVISLWLELDLLPEVLAEVDPGHTLAMGSFFLSIRATMAMMTGLSVVLPGGILLVGAGLAGVLRGPRQLRPALGVAVAGLLLVTVPPALGLLMTRESPQDLDGTFFVLRPLVYLVTAGLVLAASLSGDPDRAGPESAATAGLTAPLVIAGLELTLVSWDQARANEAAGHARDSMRETLWLVGQYFSTPTLLMALCGVLLAMVLGALAVGAISLTPRRLRRTGGLLGLIWLILPAVAIPMAHPVETWLQVRRDLVTRTFPQTHPGFRLPETISLEEVRPSRGVVMLGSELWLDGGPGDEVTPPGQLVGDLHSMPTLPRATREALAQALAPTETRQELAARLGPSPFLIQAHLDTRIGAVLMVMEEAAYAGYDVQQIVGQEWGILAGRTVHRANPTSEDLRIALTSDAVWLLEEPCPDPEGADRLPCDDDRCVERGDLPVIELRAALEARQSDQSALGILLDPAASVDTTMALIDAAQGHDDRFESFFLAPLPSDWEQEQAERCAPEPTPVVLSPEQRVVRAHARQIEACHQNNLHRGQLDSGELTVVLSIATSGAVRQASARGSTLQSVDLEQCIVDVFETMRFPEQAEQREYRHPVRIR